MKTHRLGIVGAGTFAEFALEAYRKHLPFLELAAVTDCDASAARALAERFGIGRVYDSLGELLADPAADVVLILTPPHLHYGMAKQALEVGKHVLVEKPMAFSVSEAEELVATARERGLQMSANLVLRHHPFHGELARWTTERPHGALLQVMTSAMHARYPEGHWYWDASKSGGFFLNTFCHFLDLYDFVSGETPKRLWSHGDPRNGYTVVSRYGSGVTSSLTISLQVGNAQESVRTAYVFERAVVITEGWLPDSRRICLLDGETITRQPKEKLVLYREILAQIMGDLLRRIDTPRTRTRITHEVLLNAVRFPLAAEALNDGEVPSRTG